VLLYNHSEIPYHISHGDKIPRLICKKIYFPELDLVDKLDDTWRGARGFGSTGQNEIAIQVYTYYILSVLFSQIW